MLDANNYLGKMLAERYRLVRVIGKGASSLVFYAEDMMLRREDGSPLPVAVKVLDRDSGEYKLNSKSFRTEIHAVAGIPTNPHMVAVKDISFHEDEHFIVMEYVSGKTLKEYMAEKGGKLSARELTSISLQLLQALRLSHEAGVVHRDVKPQNIMVERADLVGKQVDIPGGAEMPFVKLADFGIALLPDEDLFAMKEKGVGTLHYISPEQASGGAVDARSDLYSLGVVMYEMATGKVPFDAESQTGIIAKHQTEMPHHVRDINSAVPMALDQIIFTAMQKNPAQRYKDAATMERKLREVMHALTPNEEGAKGNADELFRASAVVVTGEPGTNQKSAKPKTPKPQKPKTEKTRGEKAGRGMGKKPLVIGALSVLVVAALVLGGVLLLPNLLHETYDITVPDLIGSVYAESNTYPDGVFVPKSKVTHVYNDEIEAGKVISQSPAPGVVLHGVEKAEIALTVSLGPEMVDFLLPAEHRVDLITAKDYLLETYPLLQVQDFVKEADVAVPGVKGGTVLGAYRLITGEELSIDGDKVYKNKSEKIVFVVQPTEKTVVTVPQDQLYNENSAKAYLAEHYPFLHVIGTAAGQNDPADPMPAGTVLGARLPDGTVLSLKGDVVVKEDTDIVLLISPGAGA